MTILDNYYIMIFKSPNHPCSTRIVLTLLPSNVRVSKIHQNQLIKTSGITTSEKRDIRTAVNKYNNESKNE